MLLNKCVNCSDVCGRHPVECSDHCQSEYCPQWPEQSFNHHHFSVQSHWLSYQKHQWLRFKKGTPQKAQACICYCHRRPLGGLVELFLHIKRTLIPLQCWHLVVVLWWSVWVFWFAWIATAWFRMLPYATMWLPMYQATAATVWFWNSYQNGHRYAVPIYNSSFAAFRDPRKPSCRRFSTYAIFHGADRPGRARSSSVLPAGPEHSAAVF